MVTPFIWRQAWFVSSQCPAQYLRHPLHSEALLRYSKTPENKKPAGFEQADNQEFSPRTKAGFRQSYCPPAAIHLKTAQSRSIDAKSLFRFQTFGLGKELYDN
jgi:hypothetical protein